MNDTYTKSDDTTQKPATPTGIGEATDETSAAGRGSKGGHATKDMEVDTDKTGQKEEQEGEVDAAL